ncbi:CMRF35-like molecule 8 isoform X2 [Peromyscus californicus insignis]|uniref:CMRF35-like molecule 8 isoform X2 n=1 Tax=Peromyscus californicus insignis TaxID=564181 RepID=UPI0022A74727|nr:CMRF35-like molecule 8 isoform X2 [Peromyscus californicus insignis]
MTQLASALWLPTLLLLLFWLPDCVPLRGPSKVTGTVGESLSVRCQYEEDHKTNDKYWCRVSLLTPCKEIVKTRASKEARKGRVSIRDRPANLTFTVTLENLTLEDAGTYKCGVAIPFFDNRSIVGINPSLGIDASLKVVVSVVPGPTTPRISTMPTSLTTSLAISLATECSTQGSIMKDHHEDPEPKVLSLSVLLTVLALLLFLLVGTSLLAWRMFRKHQINADKYPELSQSLRQARELQQEAAEQSESQYVNLQLHTLPLREEPALPSQVEVEYSTVAFPQKELHYTSVVFDSQRQDSPANGTSPWPSQNQEAEYSEVRKPREGLSHSHL